MSALKLFECVPNISEGRNQQVISQTQEAIRKGGAKLLHTDVGYDANRTVFTFVGDKTQIYTSCIELYKAAYELIDMRNHKGEHPRIGAVDVCPIVPLNPIHMKEAIAISHKVGSRIGKELRIPIYMYEKSARSQERKNLAFIRKGNYEQLPQKKSDELWIPDYGAFDEMERFGAGVLGARYFLIAYNINLASKNTSIAKQVAGEIRGSGRFNRLTNKQEPGAMETVKAIGWYMDAYNCAQVSTNITHYTKYGMVDVFKFIKKQLLTYGEEVTGSELIGLVPLDAIVKELDKIPTFKGRLSVNEIESLQQFLGLMFENEDCLQNRVIEYLV